MKKPYDRIILHPLEKPLADDINQAETSFDHALRFFQSALFRNKDASDPTDGFINNGLKVVQTSPTGLSVTVSAGLGFQRVASTEVAIDGIVGLDDLENYKPMPLASNLTFAVPAAPTAPNTRIDIIEVKADRITTDPSARQVLDVGLGQFVPGVLNKTLSWALDNRSGVVNAPASSTQPISYVVGQEGNPGVAPTTTPGYIKIAEIAVGSDVLLITDSDITDTRTVVTEKETVVEYVAANGNTLGGGHSVQNFGAGVDLVGATPGWQIYIGAGMEEGDIVDDIEVIVERLVGASNDLQTNFYLTEIDFDTNSSSSAIKSRGNTGPVGPLGVYRISHRESVLPFPDPPGTFPFVWEKSMLGVLEITSLTEVDRVYTVLMNVRRPIFRKAE